MVSKLSKIGFGIAYVGQTLDTILEIKGNDSLSPISNSIGNWSYISFYAGVVPAIVGRFLIGKGEREGKNYLVKIGEFLPKTTIAIGTLYMTLGESIFPQILPGTARLEDVPAVLLAGIATYFGVDVITKYGRIKSSN